MIRNIEVKVVHGVLEPLGNIDLPEGQKFTVMITDEKDTTCVTEIDAFRKAAGAWKGDFDTGTLIDNLYAARENYDTRPIVRLHNRYRLGDLLFTWQDGNYRKTT